MFDRIHKRKRYIFYAIFFHKGRFLEKNTYTHTHTHTHISIKYPEDYKRDEKQWPERRGPI